MPDLRKIILSLSVCGLLATPALAQNPLPTATDVLVKYGDVEGWTVYKNQTRGDCLIVTSIKDGAIQMGVTPENKQVGYLGVFTKHKFLTQGGGDKKIYISLGGNLYEGVSTGVSSHLKGGYYGGYILTDNPVFIRDIAKKYEMIVFPETPGAFIVDLTGTYKSMKMARECLKS